MTKKKKSPPKRYGLNTNPNRRKLRDMVDFDYLDKIDDPAVLDWLDKFSREYYIASFSDDNLHKTDKQKRDIYNANNARQRDAFTQWERVDIDPARCPEEEDEK